jgi:3-hydroxy-3-methylglutaryl CoA synthase
MRGIIGAGGYVPFRRLQRSEIRATFGSGGGKGTRSVAGFDEDTTTMGVEAARLALRQAPSDLQPDALWFSSASPAYLEKTNATTVHAALRLDRDRPAIDVGGAVRSGVGALRTALEANGCILVVTSDVRDGLATGSDESAGGDGAAAILVGDDAHAPVIAEHLGSGTATEEFVDRWRVEGDRAKQWEERFGEQKYVPLAEEAWNAALKHAELSPEQIDMMIVTGVHPRAARSIAGRLGTSRARAVDDLSASVGNTGTAHPAMLLASALESAEPGQTIGLVVLADGVETLVLRATDAIAAWTAPRSLRRQIESAEDLPYGKFLAWKGMVSLEPPRRPEHGRISASFASRRDDWKYGFVGSRDRSTGALHLPPQRASREGEAIDDMEPAPMSDVRGTIAAITIDRIAYSPSPPIVFAVVDFDGGGRAALELTDVNADTIAVGDRVEMTFRRLFTADGLHNYFWKARPVRGESEADRRGGVAGSRHETGGED